MTPSTLGRISRTGFVRAHRVYRFGFFGVIAAIIAGVGLSSIAPPMLILLLMIGIFLVSLKINFHYTQLLIRRLHDHNFNFVWALPFFVWTVWLIAAALKEICGSLDLPLSGILNLIPTPQVWIGALLAPYHLLQSGLFWTASIYNAVLIVFLFWLNGSPRPNRFGPPVD